MEEGLVIRIGADTSSVDKAINAVTRNLTALEQRVQGFSNAFGNSIKTDSLTRLNEAVTAIKSNLASVTIKPLVVPNIKLPKVELPPITLPPIPNPFPAVQKGSDNTIKSLGELQAQLKRFQGALVTATNPDSIIRLNKAIDATKGRIEAIGKMNGGGIEKVGKASINSTQAVINFGRVLSDLPYGIQGVANNLDPLVASLGGGAGLGVAVAAVTSAMVIFGKQLSGLFADTSEAAKATKRIGESIAGASSEFSKASATINELKINIGLAKQGLLDKDKVVKQYNESIGKTTGQVKNLDEAERALIANGEAYVRMMFYKAAANVALAKAAEKAFEAEQTRQKKLKEFTKGTDAPVIVQEGETVAQITARRNEATKAAEKRKQDKIAVFNKEADDLNTIASTFQKKAAEISKKFKIDFFADEGLDKEKKVKAPKPDFAFFDSFFKFDPNSAKLSAKQKDDLLGAARKFQEEYSSIIEGVIGKDEKGKNVVIPVNFTLGDAEGSLKAAQDFYKKFKDGFVKFKAPKITIDGSQIPVEVTDMNLNPQGLYLDDFKKNLQQQFEKGFGTGIQVPYDVQLMAQNVTTIQQDFSKKFAELGFKLPAIPVKLKLDEEGLADFYAANYELTQSVQQIYSEAFANIGVSIGESLANAIDGSGLKSGMEQMVSFIGDALQQLGKALIQYGIKTALAQKILASNPFALGPGLAIAAGIASVAAGTLVKNSFKPKPMAEGGLLFGPTNILAGEYTGARNNPEVIAPLNKLKDMLPSGDGGNMHLTGEFRVKGTDLILTLDRATRHQSRNY